MPDADAAVVVTAAYDVIAWNPLAEAPLGDLRAEPDLAGRRFPHRSPYVGSATEEFADTAVARLRAAADRHPRDEPLARLLTESRRRRSRRFRRRCGP